MKVKDLIAKLEQQNQDAEIITITIVSHNDWEYTSEPVITASNPGFNEKVWIN